jgi:hypothetical protein
MSVAALVTGATVRPGRPLAEQLVPAAMPCARWAAPPAMSGWSRIGSGARGWWMWCHSQAPRLPVLPMPRIPLQPMDVTLVVDPVISLVEGEPAGRAPDLGGPDVRPLSERLRAWLALRSDTRRVLPLPWCGALASGALCADRQLAGPTFEEWLRARPCLRGR